MVRFPTCSLFLLCRFFHLYFVWHRVVLQLSISRTWQVFIYTACRYRRCCWSASVLLPPQVPLFVIVCRMWQMDPRSLNLIPSSVFFLFISTRLVFNVITPWQLLLWWWLLLLSFSLNRSFYSTTSAVPPVSFLILYPREIQILWSQTVRQKNQTLKIQGRQINRYRTGYASTTKKTPPEK